LFGRVGSRAFLTAAWIVAATATAGSLYFSEILMLVPCELCWAQRIFAYPLVVVLGVAAWENRAAVVRSVLPLSVTGGVIAAYHSYIQATPSGGSCGVDGGCSSVQYQFCSSVQYQFVGLSIPNLALTAFVLITLGALAAWVAE
jgi:disulfide bond formation protein DsbB